MGARENEDYWAGALWVYHADITNDGSNSGNHQYVVTPGAGNEMRVLYGTLANDDTSTRASEVWIRDAGGRLIARLRGRGNAVAGDDRSFPLSNVSGSLDESSIGGSEIVVAGAMDIIAVVESVATSQDTAFAIVCRIRGGIPTVVLTSPTDAVETVNTNRTF